jgi:hypothetical protein
MAEPIVETEIRDNGLVLRLRLKAAESGALTRQAANRVLQLGQHMARLLAPKDTGLLASRIIATNARRSANARAGEEYEGTLAVRGAEVRERALAQEEGTGVFGRYHREITPRTGNVLVFDGGGRTVFAAHTKGVQGKHYMARTEEAMREGFVPMEFDDAGRRIIDL